MKTVIAILLAVVCTLSFSGVADAARPHKAHKTRTHKHHQKHLAKKAS
ncbi:MAG: hypothetical protein K8T25_01860 [Planctomycetia bacterium]|nr:hypothetical protein [Planctomycetia bacterium]